MLNELNMCKLYHFLVVICLQNLPVFCPFCVSEVWLHHNYPSQSALWTQTGPTQPLCLIRIKNIQFSPVLFPLFFILSPSKQLTWLHIYLITPKIAKRRKKSRLIIYILRYHLENFIRSWTSSKDICNIFTISVTQCQNGIPQRNNIHDCVLFAYGYELFLDLKKIRFVNKYTVS